MVAMGVGGAAAVAGPIMAADASRQASHEQKDALGRLIPQLNAPPPVMPTADSDAVMRAKKSSLLQQVARRGRQSTFLSGAEGDTLG